MQIIFLILLGIASFFDSFKKRIIPKDIIFGFVGISMLSCVFTKILDSRIIFLNLVLIIVYSMGLLGLADVVIITVGLQVFGLWVGSLVTFLAFLISTLLTYNKPKGTKIPLLPLLLFSYIFIILVGLILKK